MSAEPEAKSSNSLRFVVIIIVFLSVVFALGLGLLIFYMVRPSGEKVGATSLTDPSASLLVNGKRGDSLVFRVDASIGVPRISLLSDDELERQANRQLSRSKLTVRATPASGGERNATCAVYKGRAASTTSTSGAFARSGMLNDCVIVLDQSGSWQVRATVEWAPDVTLNSATLETRLEAAAR
jgi:hypothetical protein